MLDNYLENLQEDQLQESPVVEEAVGVGIIVAALMKMFITWQQSNFKSGMKNVSKRGFEYEKKLGAVLGGTWRVYKFDMPDKEFKKQYPDMPDNIPNAMVVSNTNDIFVTNGLIKLMTEREVIAVLIHEAEHIKNNDSGTRSSHISINYGIAVASGFFVLFLPLIVFIMLQFGFVFIGRKQETRADLATVKYGYGRDLASALTKMEKWWKKNVKGTQESSWLDEHPPIKTRVAHLITNVKALEAATKAKVIEPVKRFLMKALKV